MMAGGGLKENAVQDCTDDIGFHDLPGRKRQLGIDRGKPVREVLA